MDSIAQGKQSSSYTSQSIYAVNNWWVFGGLCLLSLFTTYYLQTRVLTEEVYYNSLAVGLATDRIDSIIQAQRRFGILSYVMAPVGLMLRILFTSFCLYTGLQFTTHSLPFSIVFKIALFADIAFAASILLRLFILSFFREINTLGELQAFAPLSVFSLLDTAAVPVYLQYPLQTLNLFEVLYCLFLAAGLGFFLKQPLRKMVGFVLTTYGLGLLCWVVCIVFLYAYLTPG